MPWEVKKDGSQYCVFNQDTGEKVPGGCHKTKQEAIDHMKAIYSNYSEASVMAATALPDVVPHTPIELVTIPDVEIGEVGENWRLSTGLTTFTQEDFQAAVAAMDDPFIRTPKL